MGLDAKDIRSTKLLPRGLYVALSWHAERYNRSASQMKSLHLTIRVACKPLGSKDPSSTSNLHNWNLNGQQQPLILRIVFLNGVWRLAGPQHKEESPEVYLLPAHFQLAQKHEAVRELLLQWFTRDRYHPQYIVPHSTVSQK